MSEDAVIDALKKKRSRPDRVEANKLHATPEEISRDVESALAIISLPDIDTDDPKQVERRIGEYFDLCIDRGRKPSVVGLAASLGVDRMTLYRWANDRTPTKPKAVCDMVKKAYLLLEEMLEHWTMEGKINYVAGIFYSKNHFGYTDRTEVEITPKNPLNDGLADRAQLEERYRAAVVAPDDGSDTEND